jgi:hypothetical protein
MDFDPTNPGFPALRVTLQDRDIRDLMALFPKLSRTEISDAISRTGPMRAAVEAELTRISKTKR